MRQLNSQSADFWSELDALLNRSESDIQSVDDTVAGIIQDVRQRGDAARRVRLPAGG